jgi:hypothetical protein
MRPDLFQDRKDIHVKLTKEVHSSLRAELFKRGISMQEAFNEFARLVGDGDNRALRILDSFVVKKLRSQLEDARRDVVGLSDSQLGELDRNTLYHLIEGSDQGTKNEAS